jgi:16S rRNA (uracil1498-N3)-methyltransferase
LNIFYQPEIKTGILSLDEEEVKHAIKVLRLKDGDSIQVTDGKGGLYIGKITKSTFSKCEFQIIEETFHPKRNFNITIAIAPTKNSDRIEWFVEKAVETGIEKIEFMVCKNSERTKINIDRVNKIAISAMKQSGQFWLPGISELKKFNEVLNQVSSQKFICYVDSTNTNLLKSLATANSDYLVLIGPEGDFSTEELKLAMDHGFQKVSLGSNRLRTETAGLAACQILNYINM